MGRASRKPKPRPGRAGGPATPPAGDGLALPWTGQETREGPAGAGGERAGVDRAGPPAEDPSVITSAMMVERAREARRAHAERSPGLISGMQLWNLRDLLMGVRPW